MITHDLQQGSNEWLAFRATHFTASDAPAMMGESPYKTRSQLLAEKHTGMAPDVEAATQRRFDDGHRFEALARPQAEKIIGEPLSPVTGSHGDLSASFDGITFMGDVVFEHKTLNDDIRAAKNAHDLDLHYRIQMEQQLYVSGADRCLFMATKWDGDDLLEQVHNWYFPDMALRTKILDGWVQFAKDLADYVPRDITEKPQAETIMQLPALAIQIKGEVTLSNLPAFKEAAETFIAKINTDLKTDEDFAQAEETVKFCKEAEADLDAAKKAAIGQTASIDELMRTIDHIQAQLRDKRLVLDKLVKTEKEAIKQRILMDAASAYRKHILALESEIEPIKMITPSPDFAGAMKGKKTMSSLHNAVDTELANGKIAADYDAREIRNKLTLFNASASSDKALFPDLHAIIHKPADDFRLLVDSRIAAHKQDMAEKIESERKRIQAEEEDKDQAKARAENMAEQNKAAETLQAQEQKQIPVSDLRASVVEHQDEISSFLKYRDFGKEENKVRAILVEFIKWQAAHGMKVAA